jgi:D-arginine dehydrogenase
MSTVDCDYLVVGAGIAGASVGYWLAPYGRVIALEMEMQPAYHSTGRSAAMTVNSYGPARVQQLTIASRRFLESPPPDFTDGPLLQGRGALVIARAEDEPILARHWTVARIVSPLARQVDAKEIARLIPVIRTEDLIGGVFEPDAADIDVHALLQGFLRGIRRHDGRIVCNAHVGPIEHLQNQWTVEVNEVRYRARVLVNAAGAWCDEVAKLAGVRPVGLVPKRRTAFTFAPPLNLAIDEWPFCVTANRSWYMKPDAGVLLGSPANEDPVSPHDVQPEDLDIATGIDAIEGMTSLKIRRPIRTWAGLRSFVADGAPVGGFDPEAPGFFWIAGLGGYGVQTSVAMGESCASLIRGCGLPDHIARGGVTEASLSPARLQMAAAVPAT